MRFPTKRLSPLWLWHALLLASSIMAFRATMPSSIFWQREGRFMILSSS
jgi:hypothetical protein